MMVDLLGIPIITGLAGISLEQHRKMGIFHDANLAAFLFYFPRDFFRHSPGLVLFILGHRYAWRSAA